MREAVRLFLEQKSGRGGPGRAKAAGGGGGGTTIAAVSITNLQNMVDSLPGEKSSFLPHTWLVDSGAEVNVCFDYNQFCYIYPSDIAVRVPVGSKPREILGKVVVRTCAGDYVDHHDVSHTIDLEIDNVC